MKIKHTLGILLAALALLPVAARADSNRYLLVIETTRGMKREMSATRQCVTGILAANFAGQAQNGDTLGVWTYDTDLHAGAFPMQEWSDDGAKDIAKHLDEFLKQQHCKGDPNFDNVMAGLKRVISDSDSLTILIFSDGFTPMKGTPFDDSINNVYAQHRNELRDNHVPFVTLLQAQNGKLVHGSVDSAVGPVDIPEMPAPPKAAQTFPAAPAPAPVPPPPPVVVVKTNAPLILDYSTVAKKSTPPPAPVQPAAAPAPLSAPASSTTPPGPLPSTAPQPAPQSPPSPVVYLPPVTPTTAPPQAAAVPAPGGLILAGLALVLALVGLVTLFFWRSRSTPRTSVITQSINQSKK